MKLELRPIDSIQELREIEFVQREVWGLRDLDIVPALVLKATIAAGGSLIGAFHGNEIAGFVYAFVGLESGETILHSDMLAVRTQYRGTGLGVRLKLAQRERAMSQGIARITWTFDPLQSENAHLNFRKLGVTSDRYIEDFYGETSSPLHQATETDRLWVSWKLDSRHVLERITGHPPTARHVARRIQVMGLNGVPQLQPGTEISDPEVAIEIPSDFRGLVAVDPALAEVWREASRRTFQDLFSRGYSVTDFVRGEKAGTYLLSREAAQD
ncbi:MAG TPA: GNAT family N-acetyltransferase [Thermoanaerobaculia bacterium]|nr:GNAT family N-acetyltransferase [Thermoanaerobaculia bacterium]